MKRLLSILILALLTPAASFGSFSIFGSYWETDEAGGAYGVGLRYGITIVPQLQVELGGSYYEKFERQVTVSAVELGVPLELEVIPLDVGLRLDLGRPGSFYLGVGGTAFLLDSDVGEIDEEFGYYGALGYQFGKFFFIEAIYRSIEGTIESIVIEDLEVGTSEAFDVDLSGIGINAGFRW